MVGPFPRPVNHLLRPRKEMAGGGAGIFLALLGTFIWLLAKADETSKRAKALVKEKGLQKK